MRRFEEQIRVLQEDLESEMSLRRRIEHEKQQFQMQIISLSERLTEAESGSESQLEINRKREAEMAKLRKLLEDVHNESEQQVCSTPEIFFFFNNLHDQKMAGFIIYFF